MRNDLRTVRFDNSFDEILTEIEKMAGTGTSMQHDEGQECDSRHVEYLSRLRSMVGIDHVEGVS